MSAGFISHEGWLAFVTEEELFGKGIRHRPQTKSPTAKFFSSLDDLKEGDLVVHLQHGIGRYLGLRRLEVQEYTSDYVLLQFGGTDTLYVPLDRLNQIHRYRGAEQRSPRLDRLGGTSWGKTKAKVKKGIEDMTEELVELYANREEELQEDFRQVNGVCRKTEFIVDHLYFLVVAHQVDHFGNELLVGTAAAKKPACARDVAVRQ